MINFKFAIQGFILNYTNLALSICSFGPEILILCFFKVVRNSLQN